MRIVMALVLGYIGSVVGHASGLPTSRDEVRVTVRVHDYARVDQNALARAQQLVAGLYAAVGVRTDWMATICPEALADRRDDGLEELSVIVVNARTIAGKGFAENVMGSAVVGPRDVGRIAYVLYDRVEDTAEMSSWPTADFLAVVMAHELGHLLLPRGSHTRAGLMRGDWTVGDLRRAVGPRRLSFSPEEGDLMRQVLAHGGAVRKEPHSEESQVPPRNAATRWARTVDSQ